MKKIILTISCCLFLLVIPLSTYAATIDFKLISNTQNYKIEEAKPLVVSIQLGDFISIPEGTPLGYTATIEYDKSKFKNITVTGKNGWNALYSKSTNKIEGDIGQATANTTIAELSFKLKEENIKRNETTIIKLKDILISDGNFEIKAEKEIKINIINEKVEAKTQQIKDIVIIAGENSVNSATSSKETEKLPNAGMKKNIVIAIGILVIFAIIFKIKSRKIN